MNRNIIRSIFAAIAMLTVIGARAATETVNGITWNYTVSDGKAEIYNSNSAAISSSTTGAITIPPTLGGYPVTSIGAEAFSCCSGLTSVTIPDSVTSIVESAFHGCSGLGMTPRPRPACSRSVPTGLCAMCGGAWSR